MHHRISIPLILLMLALAWPAQAQVGLTFQAGWNGGVHSDLEGPAWIEQSEVGPYWGVSLFNGHFGQEGRKQRWGLGFSTQQIKAIPDQGEGYATKFRATFIQLETERLLYRSGSFDLYWVVGAGLVKRSDENENEDWNYCDTAFCGLPDFDLVISPGVKASWQVSGAVQLWGQVRGNLHNSEAGESFPYKSGIVAMAGVEFRISAGPKDEPVQVPIEPGRNQLR
jgi:hypothetical protein